MPLRCESISHAYHRGATVLDTVSASFEPASFTAIVGPNGAGKTTLLRCLGGLLDPSSGRALLGESPIRSIRARARAARVAYVPQRPEVGFGYTVAQVVGFGRYAAGEGDWGNGAGHSEHAERALDEVGLLERADEPFIELSVGQQQRAVLARAMAQLAPEPTGKVLLADEPFSAMDPAHAHRAMGVIRDRVGHGLTAVVVLHDLTLARRHADRGLVLDGHGRVVAHGVASETLTPGVLGEVFGVEFAEVEVNGSTVILPTA